MSPSEQYAISFQNSEPKYYTRVPNIIDHLTYDCIDKKTGEKSVKRLSVYAKELYRVIRSIANDHNACWRNRDDLAYLCNMSAGQVSKCKEELQQKFHQLDGNPLIEIKECKKSTETYGAIFHKMTIVNIWPWNNAFMSCKKNIDKMGGPSPHDIPDPGSSPHDIPSLEGPSPHDINNNPTNKNPMFKEQQPTPSGDSVVSSIKKDRLFPAEEKRQAYEWMCKNGCFEPLSYKTALNNSLDDISKASEYTARMCKKSKKENIWAYFHDTLKNRYWEK